MDRNSTKCRMYVVPAIHKYIVVSRLLKEWRVTQSQFSVSYAYEYVHSQRQSIARLTQNRRMMELILDTIRSLHPMFASINSKSVIHFYKSRLYQCPDKHPSFSLLLQLPFFAVPTTRNPSHLHLVHDQRNQKMESEQYPIRLALMRTSLCRTRIVFRMQNCGHFVSICSFEVKKVEVQVSSSSQ